jgi:hypothetical protein
VRCPVFSRILKFEAIIPNPLELDLPEGSEVLTLQLQNGVPCLWVLCNDTAQPSETRRFEWFGTGQYLAPAEYAYVGTCQFYEGRLVLHLFERLVPLEDPT